MDDAIAVLEAQGAQVVDPADIPSVTSPDPDKNLLLWSTCTGPDGAKGRDANCSIVFKYGMKRDFNLWLASLGSAAPVKTLAALRAWNTAHEKAGALKYGQAQLDISDEMDLEQRSRALRGRPREGRRARRPGRHRRGAAARTSSMRCCSPAARAPPSRPSRAIPPSSSRSARYRTPRRRRCRRRSTPGRRPSASASPAPPAASRA